jgi:polyribonucleotide nucleotidyltransferase
MSPINFLIEENYAESPEAALKILEAASGDFYEYIIEVSQRYYDNLQAKLSRETDPTKKEAIRKRITEIQNKQRQRILNAKPKRSRNKNTYRKSVKKLLNRKRGKKTSNFVTKTGIGLALTALTGM